VGARLSTVTMDRCREAAEAVLGAVDAAEARSVANRILE